MYKKVISLPLMALLVIGLDGPVFGQQAQVGFAGRAQPATSEAEYLELIDEQVVNYSTVPHFGGPMSVGAQVKADAESKHNPFRFEGLSHSFQPYFDFKDRLNKQHGFSFGGDYNLMVQAANKSPGEDHAAGGVFRLYGSWQLTGGDSSDSGSLVFKIENRHKLSTDIAPQQLGPETGYAGLTAITYSDAGNMLSNLYWQQSFNNNQIAFVAGIVDSTDYVAVYGLVNPWTDFSNLAFSTDPTIPAPNQGGGVAIKGMLTENLYLLGGLADANGDPTEPGDSLDSFFNDHEFFKHLEFGWISSFDNRFKDNIHLTLWQSDERKELQIAEGHGVSFSFNKLINERWLPFLRAGYSNGDGGAFLERSLSVGFGYFPAKRSDTFGVGVNWGKPAETPSVSDPDSQYTAEIFYRFQLFQHMTITPDIQYLKNPGLSTEKTTIWVAGLRARMVF